MADTGFIFTTRGTHKAGIGPDWNNPSNIEADDGANASAICGNSIISDLLNGDLFGFAIPTGATIDGVEVEIVDYKGVQGGA